MKLSIITVSYNAEHTIERAIKSVVFQNSDIDIEYIVIDGGSSDRTPGIIEKYDSYVTKWVSEPDNGIYHAMNKGIRYAHGDWVGILNSDDWYAQDAFLNLGRVISSNQQCDVVVGGVVRVTEDGSTGKVVLPPDGKFSTLSPNNHPATFVRRDLYNSVGDYDASKEITADIDFICRVQESPNTKIVKTNDVFTFMSEGGASSTLAGTMESFAIEKKYFSTARAVRVLFRKALQKSRRLLTRYLLPHSLFNWLQSYWWEARRNRISLNHYHHWYRQCNTDKTVD